MYSVFCSAAFGHRQAASQMHVHVPGSAVSAALNLAWLWRAGAALHSHCGPLSSGASPVADHRLRQLQGEDSAVEPPGAPEHRLQSCAAWASLLWGVWGLPRSGIKPVSPALAGRFFRTVPSGKLLFYLFEPKELFQVPFTVFQESEIFPLKEFCKDQNKWKSEGARSGEHGGWTKTS